MRTGAVAALAAQVFRKSNARTYGFIGLGNTARATLLCLLDSEIDTMHKVLLLKYKDQAELFIERFASYSNVEFEILDSIDQLIFESDVLYSCITDAAGILCEDITKFRPGILVVPVHTRGFQNCDCVFDKVFSDDTAHVKGFRYFDSFRKYGEIADVMSGNIPGRENDDERILSYNIGLGLHDLVYNSKIYEMVKEHVEDYVLKRETDKFWI
jgi:ornithine cyclodeaminase